MRKAMMILAATGFVGTMVAATSAEAQWGGGGIRGGYGNAGDGISVTRACPDGDTDWGVYEGYRGCVR
jgi:hypothetical protein